MPELTVWKELTPLVVLLGVFVYYAMKLIPEKEKRFGEALKQQSDDFAKALDRIQTDHDKNHEKLVTSINDLAATVQGLKQEVVNLQHWDGNERRRHGW